MIAPTHIPDVPAAFAPLLDEIAAERAAEQAEDAARHARMAAVSERNAQLAFVRAFSDLALAPDFTLVATRAVPLIATQWRADCGPFGFELVERHDAYYLVLVAERERTYYRDDGPHHLMDGFRSITIHDRDSLKEALAQWQGWPARVADEDDPFGDEPRGY